MAGVGNSKKLKFSPNFTLHSLAFAQYVEKFVAIFSNQKSSKQA
jgi:hypothetical protein